MQTEEAIIDEELTAPEADELSQSEETVADDVDIIAEFDTEELSLICPGINGENADEYCNLSRYRELRALGLDSREAYAATAKRRVRGDTRSHLSSSIGRGSSVNRTGMTESELRSAREIFDGMSDAEIRRLYKRVI